MEEFKSYFEDQVQVLDISQQYTSQISDIKNQVIEIYFCPEHIAIQPFDQSEKQISINKTVCKNYYYVSLMHSYNERDKLVIPTNFLLTINYLAQKAKSNL